MTCKYHTTSSINFEGLQMKLKKKTIKKNYPKSGVYFYGKPMWHFFLNIRTLLIYFLIFEKKIILENDFLILKIILDNIFGTFEFILI